MIRQIIIGTLVIVVTVTIQAEMFNLLSRRFEKMRDVLRRQLHGFGNTGVIVVAILYVLLVQTISVWLWSLVFLAVGAFSAIEPSLYFTLITFATVGFGDITLGPDWRLLSGLTAVNGLLAFGWSTAFLVDLVRRNA